MGWTSLRLSLCLLAAASLCACGESPADAGLGSPSESAVRAAVEKPEGPILHGARERPFGEAERVTGLAPPPSQGPHASKSDEGKIQIPPDSTWGSVIDALMTAATEQRKPDGLTTAPDDALKLALPGLRMGVLVGGGLQGEFGPAPRGGRVGLDLVLRGNRDSATTEVVARGTRWITLRGCDAEVVWSAKGWSKALWSEMLGSYSILRAESKDCVQVAEHAAPSDFEALAVSNEGLHVTAQADMPAEIVIAFLRLAEEAGFGAPRVEKLDASGRRRFVDPQDVSNSWLAAHQAPNGCFDDEIALGFCDGLRMKDMDLAVDPDTAADAGLTGLALVAFLGAGYTYRGSHPYARTVTRGLRHLMRIQRADGVFPASENWSNAAAHGFAALAMLEVFGMTGSPTYKDSAQRGLDALSGVYWAAGDDPVATAVTALVLKSAQLTNRDAVKRGKAEPLRMNKRLLAEVLEEARSYRLETGDVRAACAVLTRFLFEEGAARDKDLRAGADAVSRVLESTGRDAGALHVYIGTLGCFQGGGAAWKRMKKVIETTLIDTQVREGHVCCLRGSWAPRSVSLIPGGRSAATAAAALCLQVYYRYDRVFGTR